MQSESRFYRNSNDTNLPSSAQPEMRGRSGTDVDARLRGQYASSICKSRSAQSLKQMADPSSADDKMTVSFLLHLVLFLSSGCMRYHLPRKLTQLSWLFNN